MSRKHRVLASWSSGKDSAGMVFRLQQDPNLELAGLLTTLNSQSQRVAMHGVSRELVQLQADRLQLELRVVLLPFPCTNEQYESELLQELAIAREQGITHIAYGDLFLTDVREYRENLTRRAGLEPLFPIWCEEQGMTTGQVAGKLQSSEFEAILTCVDSRQLNPDFLGRRYDAAFLQDLPAGVDPCGERGEFHTFCFAGPLFTHPIRVETGERVIRDGFHFVDLLHVED